ncbi:MAG: hypothetical protein FJX72_03720 [Armatimonadetes bacterium]|nr:hypothetical protein [Armatimonadota bacterium]
MNPNFRAGVWVRWLRTPNDSLAPERFVSLGELIDDPDEVIRAIRTQPHSPARRHCCLEILDWHTRRTCLDAFLRLELPIMVEIETRTTWGDLFGYRFRHPISMTIWPARLREVASLTPRDLWISTHGLGFCVSFGHQMSIAESGE